MASQSAGIQQLMQAEKKNAEKVNEARRKKARKLKQAKEEAKAEIEKYRKEREKAFRIHQQKVMGSRTDTEAEVERQTEQKLRELEANVKANEGKVLSLLLSRVCNISVELHKNYGAKSKTDSQLTESLKREEV